MYINLLFWLDSTHSNTAVEIGSTHRAIILKIDAHSLNKKETVLTFILFIFSILVS